MGLRKRTAIVSQLVVALAFISIMSLGALFPFFPGVSYASGSLGDVGPWQATTSLPFSSIFDQATATYNSYAYVIGGAINTGSFSSAVYYAHLNSDGTVGTWGTTSGLPVALNNESAVAYNGYLYVVGGDTNTSVVATVYYAPINSDGTVGTWQTANSLPHESANSAAAEANGYLYAIGGDDNNSNTLSSVYYAKINSDGTVGTWQTASNGLPFANEYAFAVVTNEYMYLIGGTDSSPMVYTHLNSDGTVGTWQTASNSPTFNDYQQAVAANGYLFVYGGTDPSSFPSTAVTTVQSAPINSDGTVGSWTTSPNAIINGSLQPQGFIANGYIYSFGGGSGGQGNDAEYAPLNYTAQSSANNSATNQPVLVSVPQGDNVTCENPSTEAAQTHQDSGYNYPLGLITYCFTTQNLMNTVSLTFVTNLTPSQVVARDYNPTTGKYETIPGAIITQTTYNGGPALVVTYTVTDGGALDTDGLENQSITDPVGLGIPVIVSSSSVSAPNTGYGQPQNSSYAVLFIVSTIALAFGLGLRLSAQSKVD